MPRPPGNKREPILAGALKAFVELGYRGATLPRIADAAGVSPATCYLYFDSKEAIANALMHRWVAAIMEQLRPILDDPTPTPELHVRLFTALLEFGREHPLPYTFVARTAFASFLDSQSRQLLEEVATKELAALQRYCDAGLVASASVHEVRALIQGHARSLVDMARAGVIELTDQLIHRAAWMSWHALASTTRL